MHLSARLALGSVLALVTTCGGCFSIPSFGDGSSDPQPQPQPESPWGYSCPAPARCGDQGSIDGAGRSLIVTDPEVLAALPLEAVLARVLELHGDKETTPAELARRFFDATNTDGSNAFADALHCDSPNNPAHAHAPAAFCPRAEGKLARNEGLLDPESPDFLYPVAVVNRFDLMTGGNCGQYRIVYAKKSGLKDPNDRVFLIIEAAVQNMQTGCLEVCRPFAEFWRDLGAETDATKAAESVKTFFFEGLPGFGPTLAPEYLGLGAQDEGAGYYSHEGQIRVSEHMDGAWQFREMHLTERADPNGGDVKKLGVRPVPVKSNPAPSLFWTAQLQTDFIQFGAASLDGTSLFDIRFPLSGYDSGESALGGLALNDYGAVAPPEFRTTLQTAIATQELGLDCPADDPLTADSLLRRATAESCAGCHAPTQLLGPDRKIGCGLVWPESLGQVHIDEQSHLSPALRDVFLPHRARVLQSYLAACDMDSMTKSLIGDDSTSRRRTLGGSSSH